MENTESYQPSKEYKELRQKLAIPFEERKKAKDMERQKLQAEFSRFMQLVDYLVDNPSGTCKDFRAKHNSKISNGK